MREGITCAYQQRHFSYYQTFSPTSSLFSCSKIVDPLKAGVVDSLAVGVVVTHRKAKKRFLKRSIKSTNSTTTPDHYPDNSTTTPDHSTTPPDNSTTNQTTAPLHQTTAPLHQTTAPQHSTTTPYHNTRPQHHNTRQHTTRCKANLSTEVCLACLLATGEP